MFIEVSKGNFKIKYIKYFFNKNMHLKIIKEVDDKIKVLLLLNIIKEIEFCFNI
jgi:hypothetical protein